MQLKLPSLASPVFHHIGAGLLVLAIALFMLSPTGEVADPTLDVSNYVSYAHFAAHEFNYGSEVLPMAGPYGFVMYGFVYGGELFEVRNAFEILLKLCLGGLSVWFLSRVRGIFWRVLWLLALFTLIPNIKDAPYSFTVLLGGFFLLIAPDESRGQRLATIGVTVLLALLALMKGTQFSLACLAVANHLAVAVFRRHWRSAWQVGLTFPLSLLGWWWLAGQHLADLPRFVRAILDLSSGYNAAMGWQESAANFQTGAIILLSLFILIAGLCLVAGRNWRILASGLLLAAFAFVTWKHGFVRADGHMFILFRFAGLLALTAVGLGSMLELTERWRQNTRRLLVLPAVIAFGMGLYADGDRALRFWLIEIGKGTTRWTFHPHYLTHLSEQKALLENQLERRREAYELPRLRKTIGDASVDFYGSRHGYILLNRMNYRPRPMGGGAFNVFTPWLQDQNLKFVDGPAAPDFYLVELGSIDQRFQSQDDAQTLRAILHHYRPADTEQGIVLFKRVVDDPLPAPKLIEERSIRLHSWVEVPSVSSDQMLLMAFDLPMNLRGKLRGGFYKPPFMYAYFEGDNLPATGPQRLVPPMNTKPVILSPFLESDTDLISIFDPNTVTTKTVRRLRLDSPGATMWNEADFKVRFYTSPRPVGDAAAIERIHTLLKLPVISESPVRVVPADAPIRRFGGLTVRMLEPPGRIDFELQGDERTVSFGYGIDDHAWEVGSTDGSSFFVDLIAPNGTPQLLFRQDLHPVETPDHRGLHLAKVALPPVVVPGSILSLRTDAGPHGNGAWDWSYYTKIWIRDGAFDPLQFPDFGTLPIAVEAGYCGSLLYKDELIFMLNAPGSLTFALEETATRLRFDAGLLEGSWLQGKTDGADFVVEYLDADDFATEIWRSSIQPVANPDHQRTLHFDVALPPASSGTRLRVRTDPGPHGNLSWDWTYLAKLVVE